MFSLKLPWTHAQCISGIFLEENRTGKIVCLYHMPLEPKFVCAKIDQNALVSELQENRTHGTWCTSLNPNFVCAKNMHVLSQLPENRTRENRCTHIKHHLLPFSRVRFPGVLLNKPFHRRSAVLV